MIVHETAHCALNDMFSVCDPIPLQPMWFSPWKNTLRPAYGIIHAAFAFSWAIRVLRDLESEGLVLGEQIVFERERLVSAYPAFAEALELISNHDIRSEIERNVEVAFGTD